MSLSAWLTIIVGLVTVWFIFRYWGFALIARALGNVSATRLSPFSARGVEWRDSEHAVLPTLRVEKADWCLGGMKTEEMGLIVLTVEGVSLRIKDKGKEEKKEKVKRKASSRISNLKSRTTSWLIHIAIHHYPILARIISLRISDIRIIREDKDGRELIIKDIQLGTTIDFEGREDAMACNGLISPITPSMGFTSPPMSPISPRPNPLELSPPPSPIAFTSFVNPFNNASPLSPIIPDASTSRFSRLSQAKRKATMQYAKVSSTANQIWTRAIGRAQGSVSVNVAVSDIALILPHENMPLSARPSLADLKHGQAKIRPTSSGRSTSCASLPAFLRRTKPHVLPTPDMGYSTLANIKGVSRTKLSLGFGPKRGLLAEDTLKLSVNVADVIATVGAIDQIQEMFKQKKDHVKQKNEDVGWGPSAMPRIILRAFESATLSMSKASIAHRIPKAGTSSASSSMTDITLANSSSEEYYTVSLDLDAFALTLTAADGSNNERARNTFGTNVKSESRVRGVGFGIEWSDIAVHCIAPGESSNDKHQLLALRQADIEGISTWRPSGWRREELLFADDPNVPLVVGRGAIASVDVDAELQLLEELNAALADILPAKTKEPKDLSSHIKQLLPRFRLVLDVGPTMAALSNRLDHSRQTLSIASDGCHFGGFSSFEDIIGRRRDFTGHRKAFEAEWALIERREAGPDYDGAMSPAMLRPQYRRTKIVEEAKLLDDLSMRMKFDANIEIEPIHMHLTLEKDGQTTSHELVSIGKLHGNVYGSVSGRTDIKEDGRDSHYLVKSTMSATIDFGVDQGIQMYLWQPDVIKALEDLGAQRPAVAVAEGKPATDILDKLLPGMAFRLSLGPITTYFASIDPNPKCQQKLVRGLKLQTNGLIEYAYYNDKSQCLTDRVHPPNSARRNALRLSEDVATQAIASFTTLRTTRGRAALLNVTFSDTYVRPVYNAVRCNKSGGMKRQDEPGSPDRWANVPLKPDTATIATGHFANNGPSGMSDVDIAESPLLRCPEIKLNLKAQKAHPDERTLIEITGRVRWATEIAWSMSHVYCALVASLGLQRIAAAWKKERTRYTSESPYDFSTSIRIETLIVRCAFPLGERLILSLGQVQILKSKGQDWSILPQQVLGYVPSQEHEDVWEELGRFRKVDIIGQTSPLQFIITGDCFRIRIPPRYKLSKLILNINVSIKALKTLLHNFKTGDFLTRHEPQAEDPKRPPPITFIFQNITVEALDEQIEEKLNLDFRVGIIDQERRNILEDTFASKMELMQTPPSDEEQHSSDSRRKTVKLTRDATVSPHEARRRLDWVKAQAWQRRVRAADAERRRRETEKGRKFHIPNSTGYLRIKVAERKPAPPLWRISCDNVNLNVSALDWSKEKIVDYMSQCSISPFEDNVDFSLMVPLHLRWTMEGMSYTLRDYPLPLIRIHRSGQPGIASWSVDTPFIIAEDLHGPDTWFNVPTEVIPPGLGHADAAPLAIAVQKTITPVKTYTQPVVTIQSDQTSEFAWANSYQPAIQDMMKVFDSFSSQPKDPSEKPGFWDKFRLTLHWKVQLDFKGPVHMHLKGSSDPYAFTEHGAGFALTWLRGVQFRIGHPNDERETIQAESQDLMVVIPDMTELHDGAAIGNETEEDHEAATSSKEDAMINRRYTKPCARFVGGIRIGYGFVFERTCRERTCKGNCGDEKNKALRKCRFSDFKRHQDVILRNPAAMEKLKASGMPADSFDGFRSDFIHFSVSCVATSTECKMDESSSLHFSPKAFAHFFAWWRLFNSATSLPIRQGKLFPESPPPSKKFGRSLATIKYMLDLPNIFVSHLYSQVVPELWKEGQSQYLGVKAHIGRLRVDAHQRRQERCVRHDQLGDRKQPHKPFYAADIMMDDVVVKGLIGEFVESPGAHKSDTTTLNGDSPPELVHASDLSEEHKKWYNFADFIDADKKPFDHDPKIQIVDLGEFPNLFFGRRIPAHNSSDPTSDDVETSKFGDEHTHKCHLGKAPDSASTQINLAQKRKVDLLKALVLLQDAGSDDLMSMAKLKANMKALDAYIKEQEEGETRHVDDTILLDNVSQDLFRDQFHIHNPRIVINNTSRNLLYRYYFSSGDRRREEHTTSYDSLSSVRQSMAKRTQYERDAKTERPRKATPFDFLEELNKMTQNGGSSVYRLPDNADDVPGVRRLAEMGIPTDAILVAMKYLTLFKPQIVLRSEAHKDAVALLAMDQISFRAYNVNDVASRQDATKEILSRNYILFKGMEVFYPTEDSKPKSDSRFREEFLPLEIFLDVKHQTTDYHRMVSKTDMGINVDKFNHLRLPRGIDWPDARNDSGMPIEHLRLHQDLYTVLLPRLTVNATAQHYNALYYIVKDLLMYTDPRHKDRTQRIEEFMLAFDRKDRNPAAFFFDLFNTQQNVRHLNDLKKGYEGNLDLLTAEGIDDLFKIRNDLLEAMEQIFTVFAAITATFKRDKARASQIDSSRVNVRAGSIAWQMLLPDLSPLVKLDVEGTLYSYLTNKDGSTDHAIRINELVALNSNSDAFFSEVLTRLEVDRTDKKRKAFFSGAFTTASPVGGIPVYSGAHFRLHPFRIGLEHQVARQIEDYAFVNKPQEEKGKKKKKGAKSEVDPLPLTRTKSATSIASYATNGDEKFTQFPSGDARIMRERANDYKSIDSIELAGTVISLSWKGDPGKKKKSWTLDCADLRIETPTLQYTHKVWAFADIFGAFKRDVRAHAFAQKGQLTRQVFTKTSIFRSKKALSKLANHLHTDFPALLVAPSRLRTSETPPPTASQDETRISDNPLIRAISRKSTKSSDPVSPRPRAVSIGREGEGASLPSYHTHSDDSNSDSVSDEDVDENEEEGERSGGFGKGRVKGFLGRLGRKIDPREGSPGDDLKPSSPASERRGYLSPESRSSVRIPYFSSV